MELKVLLENYSTVPNLLTVHGLSLYIHVNNKKILFDVGPNDYFMKNAKTMGVDIAAVDALILSHAHADHTGATNLFLEHNQTAPVYANKNIFGDYYSIAKEKPAYIGMDPKLKDSGRFVFTDEYYFIGNGLEVFSLGESQPTYPLRANRVLCQQCGDQYVTDHFLHEQNLLINENGRYYLIAGCAHKGIYDIIQKAEAICGSQIDWVIGGFHLHNPESAEPEDKGFIQELAKQLAAKPTKYLTCHCTGIEPFEQLKEIMGDKIEYISAGHVADINL